jgi:hypothetical protein
MENPMLMMVDKAANYLRAHYDHHDRYGRDAIYNSTSSTGSSQRFSAQSASQDNEH